MRSLKPLQVADLKHELARPPPAPRVRPPRQVSPPSASRRERAARARSAAPRAHGARRPALRRPARPMRPSVRASRAPAPPVSHRGFGALGMQVANAGQRRAVRGGDLQGMVTAKMAGADNADAQAPRDMKNSSGQTLCTRSRLRYAAGEPAPAPEGGACRARRDRAGSQGLRAAVASPFSAPDFDCRSQRSRDLLAADDVFRSPQDLVVILGLSCSASSSASPISPATRPRAALAQRAAWARPARRQLSADAGRHERGDQGTAGRICSIRRGRNCGRPTYFIAAAHAAADQNRAVLQVRDPAKTDAAVAALKPLVVAESPTGIPDMQISSQPDGTITLTLSPIAFVNARSAPCSNRSRSSDGGSTRRVSSIRR